MPIYCGTVLRLVLSLTLLAPSGHTEMSQQSVPQHRVLTPGGDRLGYTPVIRPYTREQRLTGVVMSRDPVTGEAVMCAGAVIGSRSRSLVLTAAHCLHDNGRPLAQVAFLPGFDRGRAPLGVWPAVHTWVPARWRRQPYSTDLLPYDVGLVGVIGRGGPLEAVTGPGLDTLRTARGTSLDGVELLGYPAGRRYPGTRLHRCLGDADEAVTRGPGLLVTRNCHAPAGGSGGPALHEGAVAGVVSSSSPMGDDRGFTVMTRLGGRVFGRMLAASDRWMRRKAPA